MEPSLDADAFLSTPLWSCVLFVDLRGYMKLAEQVAPTELRPLLDVFFRSLMHAVEKHGGRVYHIAGDGLMASFGLRESPRKGARAAIACARSMLRQFTPIAAVWLDSLSLQLAIGIGIHAGEVSLLQVHGSSGREFSTLIGDTVNVAARLCDRARAGEVLFSDQVAIAFDSQTAASVVGSFLKLPQLALRGRAAPLDIWCLPARARIDLQKAADTGSELRH
jgi:adenylate cyclase